MQYMVTIGTISFRDCIREGGGTPDHLTFSNTPDRIVLTLVKATDMTGYLQIIFVMVPHYYDVIFMHYLIVLLHIVYVPNSFCILTIIPIPKGSIKSRNIVKRTIEVLLLAVYVRNYFTTA